MTASQFMILSLTSKQVILYMYFGQMCVYACFVYSLFVNCIITSYSMPHIECLILNASYSVVTITG